MNGRELHWFFILVLAAAALVMTPRDMAGQGRGNARQAEVSRGSDVTLSVEVRTRIRDFYAERGVTGAKALPPGMRNRLAQGKALPPGIAKQVAPHDLLGRLGLPRGFELLEVGMDVVLVEVATGVIRDVLMDVIR